MLELPIADKKPMTVNELAAHLRVSRRTIFNWTTSGKIPAMKITSRCIRYDLEKVMEALSR